MTRTKIIAIIVFFACVLPFLHAGGSVEVNLPMDEIQGLIAQLEQAGQGLVGQAGVELRATIQQLSGEIGERINQIKNAGKEIWQMMYADLSKELAGIKTFLRDFLAQVNDMVAKRIAQIDRALANRIDQLNDVLADRLSQLDTIITNTLVTAGNVAVQVIDQGGKTVLTVINSTVKNIVRLSIIIILVIVLVIVAILAWKGIIPKEVPQIIVSVVVLLLLFGAGGVLLFSDSIMARFFGTNIQIASAPAAITAGNSSYDSFVEGTKGGKSRTDLVIEGNATMAKLLTAKYVAKTDVDKAAIEAKIKAVQVILYPPPKPDTVISTTSSVPLGLSSKFYTEKLTTVNKVATQLKVNPTLLYSTPLKFEATQPILRLR